jgi:hypothetical protein
MSVETTETLWEPWLGEMSVHSKAPDLEMPLEFWCLELESDLTMAGQLVFLSLELLSEYELVETSDLLLELPLDYLLAVSWEDTSDLELAYNSEDSWDFSMEHTSDLESEHTLVDSLVISSDNTSVGSLDL